MLLRFSKTFPLRVIDKPISTVNASSQLLADSLGSPPTVVRNMARKIFEVMAEEYDNRVGKPAERTEAMNVA
jgi:hypothetical protein